VAALLLGVAAAPFSGAGLLALMLVAGLYIVANLTAAAMTALRSGIALFLLLPIAYATLHLSYGSGFLRGLVKFRGRWGVPGRAAAGAFLTSTESGRS
jgi:hypothetical protein